MLVTDNDYPRFYASVDRSMLYVVGHPAARPRFLSVSCWYPSVNTEDRIAEVYARVTDPDKYRKAVEQWTTYPSYRHSSL